MGGLACDAEGVGDSLPRPTFLDRLCDRGTLQPLGQSSESDNGCKGLRWVVWRGDVVELNYLSTVVDGYALVNPS